MDNLTNQGEAMIKGRTCSICRKAFKNSGGAASHMLFAHKNKSGSKCDLCNGKEFKTKYLLKKHIKVVHEKVQRFQPTKKCPLCDVRGSKDLNDHLFAEHNISLETLEVTFNCEAEFLSWKESKEREAASRFVTYSRFVRTDGSTRKLFVCHRSGVYKSKGSGKRKIKSIGSNKIDAYCPASIDAEFFIDGNVQIKMTSTHVGHTMDIGRLLLSENERKDIAIKLSQKIPISEILTNVRDNLSTELDRLHLTTRQDIWNISRSFNVNNSKSHVNDYFSVEDWVDFMKKKTDIVKFYKSQHEQDSRFRSVDFLLILANDFQLELLRAHGECCICVDGTHGLNGYNFQLYTVMVIDEEDECFPVAFMFSNRRDTLAFTKFFEVLKAEVGSIATHIFMSDMEEAFYNAWSAVMPSENTRRLFCSWHIHRAWRTNICSKIKGAEKQADVYKRLILVLEEENEDTFHNILGDTINYFMADQNMVKFGRYFSKFAQEPTTWAHCFRKFGRVNTNMFIENMHRVIKHIYHGGKKVKRLDESLAVLMVFIRDKMFQRIIKINTVKISPILEKLRQRHQDANNASKKLKIEIFEHGKTWLVQSGENKYVIEKRHDACGCSLRCSHCNSCIHKYSCTCIDYTIKWNMCKHVHFVCISNGSKCNDSIFDATKINEDVLPFLVQQQQEKVEAGPSTDFRECLEGKLKDIMEKVRTKQQEDWLMKQLCRIECGIEAENSRKQAAEGFNSLDTVASTMNREPINKKIELQRKFKNCKNVPKKMNRIIRRPSEVEKKALLEEYNACPGSQ